MTELLEIATARVASLETALESLVRTLDRIGGYLPATDQTSLREARALITDKTALVRPLAEGTGRIRGVGGLL